MTVTTPSDASGLRQAVLANIETLSPRFRQIARHLLDEPNDFAFETLSRIAERCGVQPSTIVRFAQHWGFDGASAMQRLLRDDLLEHASAVGYAERLRRFNQSTSSDAARGPAELLAEFVEGNVRALEHLGHACDDVSLEQAAAAIGSAETVFVLGVRRAFPVATYFAYLLAQAGKRLVLVDNVGALGSLQLTGMTPADLLVAISFQPYAPETVALVEAVAAKGLPILAISDSTVSPIGRGAAILLPVRETEVRGFRSIAASMALVQTLAIDYGLRRQGER